MASPYDKLLTGTSFATDTSNLTNEKILEEDKDPSTFLSIMAGIGSGLFKIPEGLFSLGASLIDLGADTNKAAEVEEFFAKINPFDEAAEATTAGKITELLVNIAIPGGVAFKVGNQLTKTALVAKKGNRYLNLDTTSAAHINKGIRTKLGFNTATKGGLTKNQKIRAFDRLAPKADKLKAFGAGAGAGGVAEGIFIGDTEDAGSFGDLLGGPTEMERRVEGDAYDPGMDLRNRLKFGIEGVAFTGLFGAAGQAIKKLRNAKDADRVSDNKILDFIKRKASPQGDQTKSAFLVSKEGDALVAGDATAAVNAVQNISGYTARMFPWRNRLFGDKATEQTKKTIDNLYNDALLSSDVTRKANESAADFVKRQQEYYKNGRHLNLNPNIVTKPNTIIQDVFEKLPVQIGKRVIINSKNETGTVIGFNKKNVKLGNANDNYIIKYDKKPSPTSKDNFVLSKEMVDELNPTLPSKKITKVVPVRDAMTGKPSEIIESVGMGPMNRKIQENIIKQIQKLNKSKKSGMKQLSNKEVKELVEASFDELQGARMGMGQLLSIIGKRLDNTGLQEFKTLMREKITGSIDRSYDIIKNMNQVDKALIAYKVPRQYMTEAKELVRQVYLKNTGKNISEADLQSTINKIMNKDNLKNLPEDGFNLKRSDVPEFNLPGFFVGKSSADDIFRYDNSRKLSEMTGIELQAMKKLLTKNDSALENIILGTQNLSTYARGVQMIDNFVKKDLLEKSKGNIGIFRSTKTAALQDFAPVSGRQLTGPEIKRVSAAARTDTGLERGPLSELKGPRVDPKQTLRPIRLTDTLTGDAETLIKNAADKEEFLRLSKFREYQPSVLSTKKATKGRMVSMPILHPVGDKYALKGNVDGIFRSMEDLAKNPRLSTKLYQNFILYPKATSQMAKTILSPFTHGRNFISAGAFAMANGMIPFADREAIRRAYNALQVPLWNARKNIKAGTNLKRLKGETDKAYKARQKNYLEGNEFYQKLLRLGVVNSQVQLGDLSALLRDVKFGGITGNVAQNLDGYGLKRMLKVLRNVKKFSEDAYTAEDDFWKIFSFIGESKRLKKYYSDAGIKGSEKFHTLSQAKKVRQLMDDGYKRADAEKMVPKSRITDDLIDEEAAAIVRNNIPNYAYVGDFIKGLRGLPFGNFVSFPAEMLRTSVNIVERGLDEVFYTTTIGKNTVRPLRNIGLQRLSGMAFTSVAVPAGVVAGFSALYDVTAEERAAMRNWVADWSKNSTLVPIRDSKTGKLGYIDFSHTNAYDTISRPFQTIVNRIAAGEQDENGMIDDFILGVLEGTKELGLPFVTESIWTEALADIYFRKGRTQDGFKVWNEDDTLGNKIKKGVAHLGLSQAPLNWKQLQRLGLSMYPKDSLGRFDKRGNEYDFGNEAAGIVGFRIIDIKPEEAMTYKISEYAQSTRNARSLFTSVALKGGVTTPQELVDAYINANRALFKAQKIMNNNINSAKILDADQTKIIPEVVGRLGKKQYGSLQSGVFRPYIPSKNIFVKAQKLADQLGIPNPLVGAIGAMANVRAQLFSVDLDEDIFPTIENPFDKPIIPDVISNINSMLPSSITNNQTGIIPGSTFGVVPSNNTVPYDQLTTQDQKLTRLNKVNNYLT